MPKIHKNHNSSIKVKIGVCLMCDNGIEVPLIAKLCKNHYWQSRAKKREGEKTARQPIRKVSRKQASRLRDYQKVRLEFLGDNPFCKVCGKRASDIHHKKGREGNLLTNKSYFLAVCRTCHQYIELHPEWAKEKGYSLNRL